MADRRIDGFFYGLFMDSAVLRENQVAVVNPRRAFVVGFALRIGRRATLAPDPGSRAYGMVYALTHDELERLYAAPGLKDYRPEAVSSNLLDGEALPALCYNLPKVPRADEFNSEYSKRLRTALQGLGFPAEYILSIP